MQKQTQDILEAAIDYAETTRRPVFFLSGKIPIRGSHGHKDATADPAEIRALFKRFPGATGIGAPVPEEEIVLDVDPRSGGDKSLDRLIREHGPLPPTVTTLTGGRDGGQHLRFRVPRSVKILSGASRLGPGLDVKAAGAYVVLPPSPHPTGGVYRWKPYCDPKNQAVAEAPPWLVSRLLIGPQKADADKGGVDPAGVLRGVPEGERDEKLYRYACSLRARSAQRPEAETLVLAAGHACRPPFPDDEALRKVEQAWKHPEGPTTPVDNREPSEWPWPDEREVSLREVPGWELMPETLGAGSSVPAAGETGTPSAAQTGIRFLTARQIADETPATPTWIAKPWVVAGGMTEVTGKIKVAGKTTWITYLCRQVLDGLPFMGEPTTASPVVYLTEQTTASFREALRRAGLLDRADFHVLLWRETVGLDWPAVVHQAVAKALEAGAKLLVVDTLPQFAGLVGDGENSSGEALAALRPLQEAAGSHGLALVTVRHDRKSGGEVGDSARGSSAFGGAMDVVVSIRRPAGLQRETVRQIDALSRFDETPGSLIIERTATGYVSLGSLAEMAEAEAEAALLDVMPSSPNNSRMI